MIHLDSKALSRFFSTIFRLLKQKNADLQELLAKPDIMEMIQLPDTLKQKCNKNGFELQVVPNSQP